MALPESNSKESQGKKTTDQEDKDFDPTPEALIDEIDDERTLEEEEALDGNNGTAVQEELDDLKKESEMPIEELLAYYERMRNENAQDEMASEEEEEEEDEEDDDDDDDDEDEDEEGAARVKADEKPKSRRTGANTAVKESENTNDSKTNRSSESSSQQQPKDQVNQQTPTSETDAHSAATLKQPTPLSNTTAATSHKQDCELNQSASNPSQPNSQTTEESSQERHKHSMTDFIVEDDDGGVFKTLLGYDLDDSDDMDEDYSCTDDETGEDEREWRRVIHIGPEYQAEVPEGLSEYDDLPPYENEDKLVWRCTQEITHERLLEFLKEASALSKRTDICISAASVPKISSDSMRLYRERMQDITSSAGSHTTEHNHENIIVEHHTPFDNLQDIYMSQSRKRARIDYELEQENAMDGINPVAVGVSQQIKLSNSKDENSDSTSQDARPELSTEDYFQDEEQLLYLLLQCNHNFDEAIRRRKLDPFKYYLYEPMSLWSQEECLGFEQGLRTFGKNFRSIRDSKVPTRTYGEVVTFYYLWKKSERHDVYTNQYKLDRKRCLSHPGTTDYMDKFIEDNESATMNASSSSSTPTPIESVNKPKFKEYLVRLDDPNQKKLPSLLKTHPMLERTLEDAKDMTVEIEPSIAPSEEVIEVVDGLDHQ